MTANQVINILRELSQPLAITAKNKRFGIKADRVIGVFQQDLNAVAKQLGKNEQLAEALIATGYYEARLLAAKIYPVNALSITWMDEQVAKFENWEMCDTYCLKLFGHHHEAPSQIMKWSASDKEFTKRAAFATLASLTMADKQANNELFLSFFPIVEAASTDERNMVKKAVSWALRSIGKRNKDLQVQAIALAKDLSTSQHSASKWIAKDTLKELHHPSCRIARYPRHLYA